MEQAVARYSEEEDGLSGNSTGYVYGFGCLPRSYFCNFCGREFGSAQALGGHMNVHRRDRARLKQSPGMENACQNNQFQHQNSGKIVGSNCFYKLACNPDSTTTARTFLSPISDSRISPGIKNHYQNNHHQRRNSRKIVGSDCFYTLADCTTTTRAFMLPISATLLEESCKKPENVVSDRQGNKDGRKRWRNNEELPLSSFPFLVNKIAKSTSTKNDHLQVPEVKGLIPDGTQDLDLELRLGFSIF